MKFFHVYNEECFKGLEKNGLLNQDTGLKIQHVFSLPEKMKFNQFAAKDSKLYRLIRDGNIPFYVDRIAGGVTYHKYNFDLALIREYDRMLGDWFLGFQLHESGSNRRGSDWQKILQCMGGKGPYDAEKLRSVLKSDYAVTPDGTVLQMLSQDPSDEYAKRRYAETAAEYIEEMKDMFTRRMAEVDGHILPCDSYYLAAKLQSDLGMRTFMPEVGCQIPLMRQEVALARGMAKAGEKTWGAYYECWRYTPGIGYTMPCFNTAPSNEWYLTQDLHPDDFTSYGENGGSSRLLQNRIYYYALMSGADYFSEEWGLNCSYTDMKEFSLSSYGEIKKSFIRTAETLQDVQAVIPFALVLPKAYSCVELHGDLKDNELGVHNDKYLDSLLSSEEKCYFGHIEDVLKLFFNRNGEIYGNEGHVITNSRFGDVMDIIYEDASETDMKRYDYLIDASPDGDFMQARAGSGLKILGSSHLGKLEKEVQELIGKVMPCQVDGLCWLVSTEKTGRRLLSIFNNEGNERSLEHGDIINAEADKVVTITFKESVNLNVLKESAAATEIKQVDALTYCARVPAAGFVIFEF